MYPGYQWPESVYLTLDRFRDRFLDRTEQRREHKEYEHNDYVRHRWNEVQPHFNADCNNGEER